VGYLSLEDQAMTTRTITIEEYYFVYVRSLTFSPRVAHFDKRIVTSVVFDLNARYKLTFSDKTERIADGNETVSVEELP
jgi:hypothetical protein